MKKIIILLIISWLQLSLHSQTLPRPLHMQLQTEFNFVYQAKFLKKAVTGQGYIAMDGEERFIFKQISPTVYVIRKQDQQITYQMGQNPPRTLDSQLMAQNNLFLIFNGSEQQIAEHYLLKESAVQEKKFYEIIPRQDQALQKITVLSQGDKIEKLSLYFQNQRVMHYFFYNTITGKKPDEKLF